MYRGQRIGQELHKFEELVRRKYLYKIVYIEQKGCFGIVSDVGITEKNLEESCSFSVSNQFLLKVSLKFFCIGYEYQITDIEKAVYECLSNINYNVQTATIMKNSEHVYIIANNFVSEKEIKAFVLKNKMLLGERYYEEV